MPARTVEQFPDLLAAVAEFDEALTFADTAYERARTVTERQIIARFIQGLNRDRAAVWREMSRH
jgi:hypothetical protein